MNKELLIIDERFEAPVEDSAITDIENLIVEFLSAIENKPENVTLDEWLKVNLKKHLPNESDEEIQQYASEILGSIEHNENKRVSLEDAIVDGVSKEEWFAKQIKEYISVLTNQDAATYLKELDKAVEEANSSLYNSLLTKENIVNMNPALDGFIAENYHATTFNLNAEACGSPYRAEVLVPEGAYSKNSVDIVIKDELGNIVSKYQSKYCKDAEHTLEAFNKGDYRGQQKLVPSDQLEQIKESTKATNVLRAPDGTTSNPLPKSDAKEFQNDAQSDNWEDLDWNEYQIKDLAKGIAEKTVILAILSMLVGALIEALRQKLAGEKLNGSKILEKACSTGMGAGVKAALTAALVVAVKKGLIKGISQNTPIGWLADIVYITVENVKIMRRVVKGEITMTEGIEKMERVTVSTLCAIVTAKKGAMIGAKIGTVFGPKGTFIGVVIGGFLGYFAGSYVGKEVATLVTKARNLISEKIKNSIQTVNAEIIRQIVAPVYIKS